MAAPRKPQPPSIGSSRPEQRRQGSTRPWLKVSAEALLEATVSVPWERPVHTARLAFLQRLAQPGEMSVHVACGNDRLGFLDVACGLTTILTDVDAAALEILAQQFGEIEERLGRLTGSLQFRQLPVEALGGEEGFIPGSIQHLTLQNLFNAHLHPSATYPRIIDSLLTVVAPGGSFFLTESEAAALQRQALARHVPLRRLAEVQGYYDENVMIIQMLQPSRR